MKQLISFRFLFCLLGAFIFFSMGSYFFPRSLIGKAAPFLTFPISIIHPGFETQSSLDSRNALFLKIKIREKQGRGINAQIISRDVEIRHDIGAIFGIPLVFYPLLFSWPGIPVRYRFKMAFLVLPILCFLISIDMSLAFLVEIEARFLQPTLKNQIVHRVAQGLSFGGRQFVGIILFAAVLAPHFLRRPIYVSGQRLERNSPCPCGSGRKYKNCCMRS
jgi:hypothetical protein